MSALPKETRNGINGLRRECLRPLQEHAEEAEKYEVDREGDREAGGKYPPPFLREES